MTGEKTNEIVSREVPNPNARARPATLARPYWLPKPKDPNSERFRATFDDPFRRARIVRENILIIQTHRGETSNLVAQALGRDDGDVIRDALVRRKVECETRVVLLDDLARGLRVVEEIRKNTFASVITHLSSSSSPPSHRASSLPGVRDPSSIPHA